VLARAVIPVVSCAWATTRRIERHCKVGGSGDRGAEVGRVPSLCWCFFFCLFLSFDMSSSTFQFPISHHNDEVSGRPAWPRAWESYPLRLVMKVLGTRNTRGWR